MTDKGEIVGQLANLLMKFVNKGKSVTNIYIKQAHEHININILAGQAHTTDCNAVSKTSKPTHQTELCKNSYQIHAGYIAAFYSFCFTLPVS